MSQPLEQKEKKMAQLPIHKGKDAELRVAGLRFEACRREIEHIDGGITLRIFSDTGAIDGAGAAHQAGPGDPVEVLRFDCFRKAPHYHAPGENLAETKIDPVAHGDGRAWVLEQLSSEMPTLLRQGGFDALADSLAVEELSDLTPRLERLFAGLAEPTETSYFEIEAAVLEGLMASSEA
jgi:hypothetical protein